MLRSPSADLSRLLLVLLMLLLAGPAAADPGLPARYAPIDGDRGSPGDNEAGTPLRRLLPSDYADGVEALAGAERPGAREVSNAALEQHHSTPSFRGASDYLWQWGQFLDHDIDLTDAADPIEPADIPVPTGDPFFDPFSTGAETIALDRSVHDETSGTDPANPRQQLNRITGWIDASQVYGSDPVRANALRSLDGTGELRTSEGDLLPFNEDGLPNAGGTGSDLFLAGDVRANEQIALTAMHTLFVREHNRIAKGLAALHPKWNGQLLYLEARRFVIAELQVITYGEFLPALLGEAALPPYRGYRAHVDPRISNVFSTAAFRFGHSALSPVLQRIGADGAAIPEGPLSLRDAFFAPALLEEGGIDPILRGLAAQVCEKVDAFVIDDVRNFLFGPPGAGGFDLASLNIQRGRDHGLPSYNAVRVAFGFPAADDFSDVSTDPEVQARLAAAYEHVDDIDVWVGGLSEDRVAGSHLGPLFHTILVQQFTALRDGDEYYWERRFRGWLAFVLRGVRLSNVIRWNTDIGPELPRDVFHVQ
jgi:hypothetical protein